MKAKGIKKMEELVLIKDLGIFGTITNSWTVFNEIGKSITNYIIQDLNGIEYERYEHEIEYVDDIEECLKKSKCNLPLEKLLDLFTKIDKRYTLYIELSQEKENSHSSVYVPYIFVCYGEKIKGETFPCVIKDGKLNISKDNKYHKNEYECALYYYDTDYKDVLFELYMNIIKRLK